MRHDQFSAYLVGPDSNQAGDRASNLCLAAARFEKIAGFNLDNADLSAQGVAALVGSLPDETPAPAIAESRAALEAYGRFLAYYRAR